jgi:general secretion pathway protein G
MKAKSGFTLVEILIVVVILGILAAIVIPQFTNASTEAKTNSLMSNLQTARSQIQLYKVQHNDALPGAATDTTFVDAMTKKTKIDGTVDETSGSYGPYLQQIPKNPFDDSSTVTEGTGTPGSGSGWYFNTSTGAFNANDSTAHAEL